MYSYIYVYIYLYIYMNLYIYIYIYISSYTEREYSFLPFLIWHVHTHTPHIFRRFADEWLKEKMSAGKRCMAHHERVMKTRRHSNTATQLNSYTQTQWYRDTLKQKDKVDVRVRGDASVREKQIVTHVIGVVYDKFDREDKTDMDEFAIWTQRYAFAMHTRDSRVQQTCTVAVSSYMLLHPAARYQPNVGHPLWVFRSLLSDTLPSVTLGLHTLVIGLITNYWREAATTCNTLYCNTIRVYRGNCIPFEEVTCHMGFLSTRMEFVVFVWNTGLLRENMGIFCGKQLHQPKGMWVGVYLHMFEWVLCLFVCMQAYMFVRTSTLWVHSQFSPLNAGLCFLCIGLFTNLHVTNVFVNVCVCEQYMFGMS